MEKKLSDYLHLYLGCKCIIGDLNWKSQNIREEDRAPYTDPEFGKPIECVMDLHSIQQYSHKLTPILRPLSSMTGEEKTRVFLWEFSNYKSGELVKNDSDNDFFIVRNENGLRCHVNLHHFSAETTRKLLKLGFDLFGLIESGLAIDSTKQPKNINP